MINRAVIGELASITAGASAVTLAALVNCAIIVGNQVTTTLLVLAIGIANNGLAVQFRPGDRCCAVFLTLLGVAVTTFVRPFVLRPACHADAFLTILVARPAVMGAGDTTPLVPVTVQVVMPFTTVITPVVPAAVISAVAAVTAVMTPAVITIGIALAMMTLVMVPWAISSRTPIAVMTVVPMISAGIRSGVN